MRRYIPSSTALTCFETAARHLSFTRAAQELHLTQSAVSRQVGKLEQFLGRELFIRLNKRLMLTQAGITYYKDVVALLDQMENTSLRLVQREDEKTTLTLSVLPTLASYWLMPHLAAFQRAHPQYHLTLLALDEIDAIDPERVDVIVHYGGDHWPRAQSHHLFHEQVIAVCAPDKVAEPDTDCLRYLPLLHLSTRSSAWPDWLEKRGIERTELTGPTFEHFHMLLEAAKHGMGAAIVPTVLVEQALHEGSLIAPFGDALDTQHEYLLSYPADKADQEPVVAFRDWILEAVRLL
ncbi:LysR substrate-binding domain-containing protein [Salinispirillum sp. LH 10-3-1]|uniref:LysR substrate-binding domain-containing protein n=1 Tax=Salinispirillum sp. LH 10-3-1 TaxID=2952525 RepID=A0AB38YH90_9GAMM